MSAADMPASDVRVSRIQCVVDVPVDGVWGPITARALQAANPRNYPVTAYDGATIVTLDDRLIASLPACHARETAAPTSSAGWWVAGALAGIGLLFWFGGRYAAQ